MTEYFKRGKHNPFDAYMAGFCIWISPRQILIAEQALRTFVPTSDIEEDAFIDMYSQIQYEAEIKRKKYLGG